MKKRKQTQGTSLRPAHAGQGNSIQDLLIKGFGFHQNGDLISAGEIYAQILKIQPLHFDALHLSGLIAAKSGQYEAAIQLISKAISINAANSSAYCNIGNVYLNIGKHDLAIENYSMALKLNPNNDVAYFSRGLAHQGLNQLNQAITDYENALKRNPKHIGALTNLGNIFKSQKEIEAALKYYSKAIALNLPNPEPFNNRGNLYHELKWFKQALLDFDHALQLNQNYPEALSNKANTLFALKDYQGALGSYNKAIALKPDYAEAFHNRGNLYRELKQFENAKLDYEKALCLKPDYDYVRGVIFASKMNLCDWNNLKEEWRDLQDAIKRSEKVIAPFLTIPISESVEIQREVGQTWVREKYQLATKSLVHFPKKTNSKKITIGYFSADFHDHATMYLMAEVFELHDKSKFEVIGFSFGRDKQDDMRRRAVAAFDQFHDVRDKSDEEVAQLSRTLGVDIAVDLKGYTLDSRVGIFAQRAAPIQVNFLGYPGTMGAGFIDYIIADRTVIPEKFRDLYSEKVAYLPHSYQPNDRRREIANRKFTRQECGLPDNAFVYCSFNANYKINPDVFDVWMEILRSVEDSVLWLLGGNQTAIINLRSEAEKRGVDPNRLIFADHMKLSEHLARHELADLFLDTWPCSAHTTASDSLWAGLPVLTLPRETFASRVAASLLMQLDLAELISSNESDYSNMAVELGKNPVQLSRYRKILKGKLKTSTLFDTPLFTTNLEQLYIDLIK
jgi:predicted O-linked N-acetylglucosamine transferase (SPINDLY family)